MPSFGGPRRKTAAQAGTFALGFIFLSLLRAPEASAYIGPGGGFAFLTSFFLLFSSLLVSCFLLLTWPFRALLRWLRRRKAYARGGVERVVILGLDGLDPTLRERFMAEGALPHLARLRAQGSFARLQTTSPSICSEDVAGEGREGFEQVDWKRTRAYGLGLNPLYLSLQGRERLGVVPPRDQAGLLDEIARKLLQVRDPATGRQVVARVYKGAEIYSGPYVASAPDIVVGYQRGYRVSSKSALGEIPPEVFGNNIEKWSGDHAMAAELVPGVLFSNKKVKAPDPALVDLAATILAEFGLPPEVGMRGRPIF